MLYLRGAARWFLPCRPHRTSFCGYRTKHRRCRSAASLRERGNLETSLPEDGHSDEATPLATETAGVHAVAPRGSALLNGRLDADARSELPADILQSIEDANSAVLAVWITRFDSLQNSLLLKEETEEQKQVCLAAFQDRVRAACNGARSDRVRQHIEPKRNGRMLADSSVEVA